MDVGLIYLCIITIVFYLMLFGVWYVYRDKPDVIIDDGHSNILHMIVRDVNKPIDLDEAIRSEYQLSRRYRIESFVWYLLDLGASVVVYDDIVYYKTAFGVEAAFNRENTLKSTLRVVRYAHHRMHGKLSDLKDIINRITNANICIRNKLPHYLTVYCIAVFPIGETRIYDCFELANSSRISELVKSPIATLS